MVLGRTRPGHPAGRPLQPAVQPVPGRAVGRLPPHPARPRRRLHPTTAPEGRRVADPRLRRPRRADGPRGRGRQDRGDDHRRPGDPPHRPDRRHRPVRRARQHGRTVRPRLPAAVSGRPGADAARGDAEGRSARVRRPDGDRRLRRRDLLAQPAQDDPAVPRRRARGARTAARRLHVVRPDRDAVALGGPTVGPPAREGTGPPRRAEAGRRGPGGHLLRPDGCRDARRRRSPPGQEHPAQHRTPRAAAARRVAARRGDPGPHRLRPIPPRRRRRSSWRRPPR